MKLEVHTGLGSVLLLEDKGRRETKEVLMYIELEKRQLCYEGIVAEVIYLDFETAKMIGYSGHKELCGLKLYILPVYYTFISVSVEDNMMIFQHCVNTLNKQMAVE